jgi:hypothetical protein
MTGAIGVDFEAGEFAPPPMNQLDAVQILLEGHAAKAYVLPGAVLKADAGYRALMAAMQANNATRTGTYPAGWEGAEVGRLVARYLREATTSGALPKVDIGAMLATMRSEAAGLVDEYKVLSEAADKAEPYPANAVRSLSGTIHAALDAALAELLAKARPHSGAIALVKGEVAAVRVDRAGFDALDDLTPRLLALEAARDALAALGAGWSGLDGAPAVREPVLRLAVMATTPAEPSPD